MTIEQGILALSGWIFLLVAASATMALPSWWSIRQDQKSVEHHEAKLRAVKGL